MNSTRWLWNRDRYAFDCGDDGLRGTIVAKQCFIDDVGVIFHTSHHVDLGVVVTRIAAHALEVGAGTEIPSGTRDENAADLIVLGRLFVGVVHANQHRARERVEALGPVHGDGHQMTVAFDDCVGQLSSSSPLRASAGNSHRHYRKLPYRVSVRSEGRLLRSPNRSVESGRMHTNRVAAVDSGRVTCRHRPRPPFESARGEAHPPGEDRQP